jgi:ferric-dicitrate binding protein FerR (iron transport regulator)
LAAAGAATLQTDAMVDRRITPYKEQKAAEDAREAQRRATVRNQAVGMVILAAAALVWWLVHTNPGWIFPAGWWHW